MKNHLTPTKTIEKAPKKPLLLQYILDKKSSKIDPKLTYNKGYQLL